MISANEARKLVQVSDVWVEGHLTRLDKEIRKLAEDGKTYLDVGGHDLTVTAKEKHLANPTLLMTKLAEKIRTFGYTTQFIIKERKPFPGFGPIDEDDEPGEPEFVNFIRICW